MDREGIPVVNGHRIDKFHFNGDRIIPQEKGPKKDGKYTKIIVNNEKK